MSAAMPAGLSGGATGGAAETHARATTSGNDAQTRQEVLESRGQAMYGAGAHRDGATRPFPCPTQYARQRAACNSRAG